MTTQSNNKESETFFKDIWDRLTLKKEYDAITHVLIMLLIFTVPFIIVLILIYFKVI